jgi:hypothetical protein
MISAKGKLFQQEESYFSVWCPKIQEISDTIYSWRVFKNPTVADFKVGMVVPESKQITMY